MVVNASEGRRRRRAKLMVGVALGIAVAGAGGVIVASRGTAEAATVDPETRAILGVFRDARTAQDDIPGDPQGAVESADDLQPGENMGLSRRVEHAGSDAHLWPMDAGVCYRSVAGSGCVPTKSIREHGVELGVRSKLNRATRAYEDVGIFGIARDGIETVTLRLHSGQEIDAAVRENTFLVLELPDQPAWVSWIDDAGRHTRKVPSQTAAELSEKLFGP